MDALPTRQSPRPERPVVPLIDPLAALDITHREVLLQMGRLQALLDRIEAQGVDAETRAVATEVCDFFGGRARRHHEDEEEQIFPLLLSEGDPALVEHVRRLQQDHGWLEEDWLELGPQLATLAAGYSGAEVEQVRQGVATFAALYLEHISLEEGLVFPAARKVLERRMPTPA